MHNAIRKLIFVIMLLSMILPSSAIASPRSSTPHQTDDIATITVLHTNDVHGTLEPNPASSYPGMARLATTINTVRAAVGISNTLLLDAGDEMQGSLLSNIQKGKPTIDIFNLMGYGSATFGNHEFDWGQTILYSRTLEADYPYISANIVVSDTGSCSTAGWTSPAFARPWTTVTVGAPGNQAVIGIIGVTTQETPYITIQSATTGLCFKDPADSIIHYYDAIKAAGANAIIVLSHLGLEDGGYGYGFPVYGDKTLANKLFTAGKLVDLIIGGHSHTNMATAFVQDGITIAQAHSSSRKVGQATLVINKTTGAVTVTWTRLTINMTDTKDPTVDARISGWASDPAYQALINQVIGYTDVGLVRNYNGDSLMGEFINDSILFQLNSDGVTTNDSDIIFNNAGGLRADITSTVGYPYTLTYGAMFSVLPFGNATAVGDMTGAQIQEILNQSATLFKGTIQPAGIRHKFYRYSDALPGPQPFAWGAYDAEVRNRTTGVWETLEMTKTYRVATNEFLAPAGQDGYVPFKYMTNISYWGDMLNIVNAWVSTAYSTTASAYDGPNDDGLPDGRIWRNGTDTLGSGTIIPISILHHNDSHGRLLKSGSYQGYSQLATLITQERAHNPGYTILLASGDELQGDSMMYYFKSAAMGYAADGTTLPITMTINPFVKAMNAMNYTAFTLGNHEFNFGNAVFTSTLSQANFPILQANLTDDGRYGLAEVPVRPYITVTLGAENITVAILGIGNHRVPNYELPSNILGLTFTNPIVEAQNRAPGLQSAFDVVVALTHIGFTQNPGSVEVDNNVDTVLAAQVSGIDAVIGGHSHTDPSKKTAASGSYKYLPTIVGGPDNVPVIVTQAYRYNTYLGEVVLGVMPDGLGGYKVVTRAGRYLAVDIGTTEDPTIKNIVNPYQSLLNAYNNTVIGQTTVPIDTLQAFTQETNGANLQADASVYELTALHGIPVDFHLSGAMTNAKIAAGATPGSPVTLKISDMFSLMPYENSLVVLSMNGYQLKQVLERAYRNYYYYKYVPGYGGYSYYTTCMLDTNAGNQIVYHDTYPLLPNGNNVEALVIGGVPIDFNDADTYYKVSTVNYLAAGSCNFNDAGLSLWPLNQIVADTQYYVRDVTINYIKHLPIVSPAIEGRLVFKNPFVTTVTPGGATYTYIDAHGSPTIIQIPAGAVTQTVTLIFMPVDNAVYPEGFGFAGHSFVIEAYLGNTYLPGFQFLKPLTVSIYYTDADATGLNENYLTLFYWNGGDLVDAACGAYDRHPNNNWMAVPICHLSQLGLFTPMQIFLPIMIK